MGISFSSAAADICQEAMFLLRQDFIVPSTQEAWSASTPIEWVKCRTSLWTAVNEVLDAFEWSGDLTADNIGEWPARVRNACVYLLARECSVPIAGRVEDMKNFDQLYRDKLQQAEISDLYQTLKAETDADLKEVLSLIQVSFTAVQKLPHSAKEITERIALQKDAARREVLLAHEWNFSTRTDHVDADFVDAPERYRWIVPYPRQALRLVSVFSLRGGRMNEWKVENGQIMASEPISAIKYVRDVSDTSKWPASARNVYIHRLAANVARTVMNNAQDTALQEQIYDQALQNAKLRDTKESNTPDDAWGDNYYVERMRRPSPEAEFPPDRRW